MSPLSSPAVAAALAVASFQVTLWITPESFVQVTTVPTATVRVVGVNVVEPMQKVFAGQLPPPPPPPPPPVPLASPPPPHETRPTATIKTPHKPERFRILPPRRIESGSEPQRRRGTARGQTLNKRPVPASVKLHSVTV